MNRASFDSDIDLLVLLQGGQTKEPQVLHVDKLRVDIEFVPEEQLIAKLEKRVLDIRELREASRLATGIPIGLPIDLENKISGLLRRVRPSEGMINERIVRAIEIHMALVSNHSNSRTQWESFRIASDNLAMASLLMSERRYHKPKWVFADLRAASLIFSLEVLVASYIRSEVCGTDSAAQDSVSKTREFIDWVGDAFLGKQIIDAVGVTHDASEWERRYSLVARTWADANSLMETGYNSDAMYVAKFSARMAITFVYDFRDSPEAMVPGNGRVKLANIAEELYIDAADFPSVMLSAQDLQYLKSAIIGTEQFAASMLCEPL